MVRVTRLLRVVVCERSLSLKVLVVLFYLNTDVVHEVRLVDVEPNDDTSPLLSCISTLLLTRNCSLLIEEGVPSVSFHCSVVELRVIEDILLHLDVRNHELILSTSFHVGSAIVFAVLEMTEFAGS